MRLFTILQLITFLQLCFAGENSPKSPTSPPTDLPIPPVVPLTPRKCAKEGGKARVAIGFFGISRCLERTMYTFEKYVFKVLDEANITYDVFWSTMAAVEESISRNNKSPYGPTNPYDVTIMNPCQLSMQDQELVVHRDFHLFLKNYNITNYVHGGESNNPADRLRDNFASVRNILCAYNSMQILSEMINAHEQTHNFTYDAVVAIRPDSALMRPIDLPKNIERIRNESRHTLWVPDMQHWGGINDCFAYGSREVMSTYFRRGRAFRDGKIKSAHTFSEFLLDEVVKNHHYKVEYTTMRPLRVRANGHVQDVFGWMNHQSSDATMRVTEEEFKRCVDDLGNITRTC